jgi:hypothetical protein
MHRRDDDPPDSNFRAQRNGRSSDTLTKWVVGFVMSALVGALVWLVSADRARLERRDDQAQTINAQQATDIEVLKTSVIAMQATLQEIKTSQAELLKEMRDRPRRNP